MPLLEVCQFTLEVDEDQSCTKSVTGTPLNQILDDGEGEEYD